MHEEHGATENASLYGEINLIVTAGTLVSWSHTTALNCPDMWDYDNPKRVDRGGRERPA